MHNVPKWSETLQKSCSICITLRIEELKQDQLDQWSSQVTKSRVLTPVLKT